MTENSRHYPIWDPLVRVFPWSLASAFLLNFLVTEEGSDIHEIVGYTAVGLVIFRLIWGMIGPHNARFATFFPTPRRLRQHLQEMRQGHYAPEAGHNPIGALMIFTLLLLISSLGMTGFMMQEIDYFFGEEWLEELHEWLANITMACVAVHVLAVILMERISGMSLVKTMITGKRRM